MTRLCLYLGLADTAPEREQVGAAGADHMGTGCEWTAR
jgi:hypothetical protein